MRTSPGICQKSSREQFEVWLVCAQLGTNRSGCDGKSFMRVLERKQVCFPSLCDGIMSGKKIAAGRDKNKESGDKAGKKSLTFGLVFIHLKDDFSFKIGFLSFPDQSFAAEMFVQSL